MGVYSTIINHSRRLNNCLPARLQTKDLDGCMDLYWIAPDDVLYRIDLPYDAPRGRVSPILDSGVIHMSAHTGGTYLLASATFENGRLISASIDGSVSFPL